MSLERIGVHSKPNPTRKTFKPVFTEDALDWKIHRAAQTPGPGNYGNPDQVVIKGGKWGKEMPLSYLDIAEMNGKQTPGPGAYEEMDAIKKLQRGATSGRFNMSKPKTYIEQVEYDNRHVPGPASYELPSAKNLKGGRFNMSKSKTEVEWICYRAAQVPAPGEYGVEERMPNGGKFNMANPKTPLDVQIMMSKRLPGPGQYFQMSDPSATFKGGKFNASKSKSDIEWTIYRAKKLPGPGQYDIEKPTKYVAKNVPKFSFQGRPGPATMPAPFHSLSSTMGSSKNHTRRSRLGSTSQSLDATATSAVSPVKPEEDGDQSLDTSIDLRASTASPSRKPNEKRVKDSEARFTDRLKTAYTKSTMRRRAASVMGFGSSFFL